MFKHKEKLFAYRFGNLTVYTEVLRRKVAQTWHETKDTE